MIDYALRDQKRENRRLNQLRQLVLGLIQLRPFRVQSSKHEYKTERRKVERRGYTMRHDDFLVHVRDCRRCTDERAPKTVTA